MNIDLDVAKASFIRRYQENHGKEIDNSKLYAGSPMYYYCNGCCVHVATLPEGWFMSGPPKYCDACKVLADHGLLQELIKEATKDHHKIQ